MDIQPKIAQMVTLSQPWPPADVTESSQRAATLGSFDCGADLSFGVSFMDRLPSPIVTPVALDWLERGDHRLNMPQRALLRAIDGRRNIIELESVARALGLRADALETLRGAGLIRFGQGQAQG